MIPKIIHYVWLDKKEKSELFYKCLESWKKFCPDFEIKEWNEDNFDFSTSHYAKQAYEAKKFGFAADYIRMQVLHDYGGVYVDTDLEITKSIDELLDNDFIISFENIYYCETAFIGAVPKHPITTLMIDFYLSKQFLNKNGKPDCTPNTPIITYFLRKYFKLKLNNKIQKLTFNENNNISATVFSRDYFSPLNYTTKKLKVTPNTYAIHYFNATWFTGKLKAREKVLRAIYYCVTPYLFNRCAKIYTFYVGKKVSQIDNQLKHKFD